MEILLELLLDLFVDTGVEVAKEKRISKWIRYPIIAILLLGCTCILGIIMVSGIILILERDAQNVICGSVILLFGIVMTILVIRKVLKAAAKKEV